MTKPIEERFDEIAVYSWNKARAMLDLMEGIKVGAGNRMVEELEFTIEPTIEPTVGYPGWVGYARWTKR